MEEAIKISKTLDGLVAIFVKATIKTNKFSLGKLEYDSDDEDDLLEDIWPKETEFQTLPHPRCSVQRKFRT